MLRLIPFLAVIWFPFSEAPQPAPTMRSNVIVTPIAPSPVEVNRACKHNVNGYDELQACESECSAIGGITNRPEPGWNPWAPVILAQPHTNLAMQSCEVVTIGGQLTRICRCFDPGLMTSNAAPGRKS